MVEQLVLIAIQQLPTIIDAVKARHASDNPNTPQPTDEQVVAALQDACDSSLAKDAAWLSAHKGS